MSSSPILLRKAQVKRKPRFDDGDNENNENNSSQITNPFDDFSQSTMETTISFSKVACEEQEQQSSQASLPSSRRRLQRISDKRQPLEIRYEAEEFKPIEKIEEEDCEIEFSKPNKPILTKLESNILVESEDEEVIEEQEEIIPKRSLSEIPELIRINNERKETCFELIIQDVTIYFPYKPYKAQIEYMMQVIDALNKGENALLQSPSGTGKTLCLLCACFGWINKRREEYKNSERKFEYERNQIVLSTKHFAEINQVIEEISKTCYEPIKSILGSKNNLCVNKSVLKDESVSINEGCKIERLNKTCTYYSEYIQNRGQHLKMYEDNLPDIEELVTAAKMEKYCPFYLQQDLVTLGRADLILLPHDYILEERINKTTGLDLNNAILIFDDAHHVESGAEEGSSMTISLEALKEISFQPLKNKLAAGLIQTNGLNEEVLRGVETIIERMMNRLQIMKDNFEEALITVEIEVTDDEAEAEAQALSLALAKGEVEIKVKPEVEHKDEDDKNKNNKPKRKYTKKKKDDDDENKKKNDKPKRKYTRKEKKKTKKITTQNYDYLPTGITVETSSEGFEIFSLFNEITSDADENGDSLFKGITEEDFPQFLEMLSLVQKEFTQTAAATGELDELIYIVGSIFRLCLIDKEARSRGKENDFFENAVKSYHLSTYLNYTANRDDYCISLTCMNPAIGFLLINSQNPRNILLTSAALKPFESFESELMTQFPIKFNNSHAIDSQVQCLTAIVTHSALNSPLNFSTARASNIDPYLEMGKTLMRIAKFVPNGILVCFPSYVIMRQCLEVWRESEERIYNKLEKVKTLFEESKDTKRVIRMMEEYKEAAIEEKGAIFFCVARGKVCETANFSDEEARAIVFAGVPNLDLKDREIEKKINFLNDNQEQTQRMTGNAWYGRQAVRALTQAMGRIIRHKDDYGMIFLCDERFAGLRNALPSWARNNSFVYNDDDWTLLKLDIREFLEDTPILIRERNQDSSCLIKLKESVPAKDNDDEIIEEKLVKAREEEKEREFMGEEEKLVKAKEKEYLEEIGETLLKANEEEEEFMEEEKTKVVKQKKENKKKINKKKNKEIDDDELRGFAVMNKFMEESQVMPLDILEEFEKSNFSEDSFLVEDSQKEKKKRTYKKKNNKESQKNGDILLAKDSQKERKKRTYKKKNKENQESNDDVELNEFVLESQVVSLDILGKRTDKFEKNDFSDDFLEGSQSTKKIKTEVENKENQESNDDDPLGGLAELNKLVLESQVIPTDILGKRTDKFEMIDFSDDFLKGSQSTQIKMEFENLKPSIETHFAENNDVDNYFESSTKSGKQSGKKSGKRSLQEILSSTFSVDLQKGSQSTKKITTEFENKENQENNDDDPLGGLAELNKLVLESQVVPTDILGKRTDKFEKNDFSDDILKGSQSTKKIKMEFENKENQENNNNALGGLAELNKLVLESQVVPLDILGKRTDKFEKNNFSDDFLKGSQSTKKIKMEFEDLKPSIEIHFVENSDVDNYFESSTKSTKQSGKKSLQEIVSSAFSADLQKSSQSTKKIKSEFENLKPSIETLFVENNNDVDNYFESSTKSGKQSGQKSGKRSLEQIVFSAIESSSFMADNENKMKIETCQSSAKKSIVENNDADRYFDNSLKPANQSGKKSGKRSLEQIVFSAVENSGFIVDNENNLKIERETDTRQSSTKKSIVENNDADRSFDNSTKSAKQSEKKSEKRSLQEIVSFPFPFRPSENNGLMADNENKIKIERETDTYQSSTKKSIVENHGTDRYFDNSTKPAKQSGKKSEKRSLQEILSSTFSAGLQKGSLSTKKIKSEFENLKSSKENNFVENNDVDKYFDNSIKSAKQSGKKSPQEIVSSAFPFRPIENIGFMANNENSMNIETEGDTFKSTLSKYLKKPIPIRNEE